MRFVCAQPWVLAASVLASGCASTMNRIAADATADVMREASPKLQSHFDVKLLGDGLPALILQMEGLLGISPDNDTLLVELTKAYAQYVYGWIENEAELQEYGGKLDQADATRARAIALYIHGRDLGLRAMRGYDDGLDDALKDPDTLEDYLREHYSAKEDVELLFWTAMSWGSAINIGRDDPDLVIDIAAVRAFANVAVELDESYYYGAPLALLGALEGGLPEALGGDPVKAKKLFERALGVSKRKSTVMLVQYARSYALAQGDENLYRALLKEALEAPAGQGELRLGNEVARLRAKRYLATADDEL